MKIDHVSEWLRPRDAAIEKVKSANEFFQRAEARNAQKIQVSVVEDQATIWSTGRRSIGTEYFNSFLALNEEGKTMVRYKEEYEDGFLTDSETQIRGKQKQMIWNCIATAKNRLNLCPEGVSAIIKSSVGEFDKASFAQLVDKLKKRS